MFYDNPLIERRAWLLTVNRPAVLNAITPRRRRPERAMLDLQRR